MNIIIKQWGNSLGMRLPKGIAEELGLTTNSTITLTVQKGTLLGTPQKDTLPDLLKHITPAKLHTNSDTLDSVGKELW